MSRNTIRLIIMLLLLGLVGLSFAQSASLGQMASNILEPTMLLRKLFNAASILLGVFFMLSAILRYFKHRRNPQEQHLSTIIVVFLLGVIFVVIPMLHYVATSSAASVGANIDPNS